MIHYISLVYKEVCFLLTLFRYKWIWIGHAEEWRSPLKKLNLNRLNISRAVVSIPSFIIDR